MFMYNLIIIMTIVTLLMTLIMILSKKTSLDLEKGSCYECGFNPMNPTRTPFSLRFFQLAILFLIFDVEISLILPYPMINMNETSIMISVSFIILLILGLMYEWRLGCLNWS